MATTSEEHGTSGHIMEEGPESNQNEAKELTQCDSDISSGILNKEITPTLTDQTGIEAAERKCESQANIESESKVESEAKETCDETKTGDGPHEAISREQIMPSSENEVQNETGVVSGAGIGAKTDALAESEPQSNTGCSADVDCEPKPVSTEACDAEPPADTVSQPEMGTVVNTASHEAMDTREDTAVSNEQSNIHDQTTVSETDLQQEQQPTLLAEPAKRGIEVGSAEEAKEVKRSKVQDGDATDTTDGDLSKYAPDYSLPLKALTGAFQEFSAASKENFLKGCKWSPDGTCLLTNSEDNRLRLFNLPDQLYHGQLDGIPEMRSVLQMPEGGVIYDYAWMPGMTSQQPDTCRLVCSSRDAPIHMWDAFTGELRCSYRAYDQADELTSAHSVAFSPDGRTLYAGFNKTVRVFDVSRPGRNYKTRATYKKTGQAGIISCIAVNPAMPTMYAAGSYSRAVALYAEPSGGMLCLFEGQAGGVTHLHFSPDGSKLYTGARKDPEILCWDMRQLGRVLFTMQRKVLTNQRVYFDLDASGRHVVSGNHDGSVSVWDSQRAPVEGEEGADALLPAAHVHAAHQDTVNGVSLHPSLPILATASGQRQFPLPSGLDTSDTEEEDTTPADNSLRLWWTGKC